MKQKIDTRRLCISAILAGCLAGSPVTVFAGPSSWQAVDGHQIPEERLGDFVIEYEELGSLIHANNRDVQNLAGSTENRRQDYTEMKEYLRSEQADAARAKREARDSGDMEAYEANASYEAIYKNAIKSYNKMIEGLDKYSSNKGQITLEKQLTCAAQSLMISYQSIRLQKEYLSRMEELLRTQYEHTTLQQSAGLATDQDVQRAYNNWSDARISLDSLESGGISVYQNLCLLLGVDETGTMEIQKIPSVDLQTIAEINLEEDTKKAMGNNLDISSTRNTESGGTAGIEKKRRTLAELEETLSVKMKELYQKIQQAISARDAAQTGYQNAQTAWNLAQSKYHMGMLDKAEYLGEEMQYIQKQAGLEAADLELLQALEDYQWAVRGIVSLE